MRARLDDDGGKPGDNGLHQRRGRIRGGLDEDDAIGCPVLPRNRVGRAKERPATGADLEEHAGGSGHRPAPSRAYNLRSGAVIRQLHEACRAATWRSSRV